MVQAGKFFEDSYVGALLGCSADAAHEAALEADVAAHRARSFEVWARVDGRTKAMVAAMLHCCPDARLQPRPCMHHGGGVRADGCQTCQARWRGRERCCKTYSASIKNCVAVRLTWW